MDLGAPYRGPGGGMRPDLPLPPSRMPLLRAGRLLKRWRYVGVYGADAMLCAGSAQVGPNRQVWWAVWDRSTLRLHERTHLFGRRGRVTLAPGRVRVDDGVLIDLALDEREGIEVITPDGSTYAWTRKQGGVPVRGVVRAGGREIEIDGRAIVDDSAGYHARHTAWRWSAGVGRVRDGREVAWNLVDGIHDSARDSERTVWVEGAAQEVAPVRFEAGLGAVAFAEGGRLRCAAEATRERNDNLLLFRSRYAQPFGTFSGVLPGGLELAEGYGVMERHDVVW